MSIPVHLFARGQVEALRVFLLGKPDAERWSIICEGLFPPVEMEGLAEHVVSGCVCCVGQLALQVTLGRVIRHEKPQRIVLYLSQVEHLERFKQQLATGALAQHLHYAAPDPIAPPQHPA
ncbi:MAG: hypothetical protein ING36_14965 [Burkholderiales bacterium]|jgi:hypothetical protein|nr:hypothetical protein [Microcystis sp. M035S1]MCA3147471.1 hypothetical protein [Burkholderiales bacterium]MCA3154108.1 hypothetical protein [Burkholderiales bacterium]MCA3156683.1 hypothetical protein [Burkholderiales bacterium]MCA3159250.1 hypothetical protein [Burkholderiales bacterium]